MSDERTYEPLESFAFVKTLLVRETPTITPPTLSNSRQTFEFARELIGEGTDKEQFWSLMLDGKHRIMSANLVSIGSMTCSLVHPREIFRPAIAEGACALILFHNHPSGDPVPSPEDVEITARLLQVAQLVGIRLLDHMIVGDGCFVSLFEKGMIHD
jgi:DNA repair protein RadC